MNQDIKQISDVFHLDLSRLIFTSMSKKKTCEVRNMYFDKSTRKIILTDIDRMKFDILILKFYDDYDRIYKINLYIDPYKRIVMHLEDEQNIITYHSGLPTILPYYTLSCTITDMYHNIKEIKNNNLCSLIKNKFNDTEYCIDNQETKVVQCIGKCKTLNDVYKFILDHSDKLIKYKNVNKERTVNDYLGSKSIDIRNLSESKNVFDAVVASIYTVVPEDEQAKGITRKDIVKKYRKQMDDIILDYISKSKKFTKYNIPINFLKLDRLVLRQNGDLVYTFGLKELKGES